MVDETDPVLYSKTGKGKLRMYTHIQAYTLFFASFENFPADNEEMVGMLLSTSTLLSVIDRFNILVKLLLNFQKKYKEKNSEEFYRYFMSV